MSTGMTKIKDGTNNVFSEGKMPWNFSWVLDSRLAGMGFPDRESNLLYLINNNIRHIISLTESRVRMVENFPEIEMLSLKVEEFTPPTLDQIEIGLDFIEKCNNNGNAVAVHCRHGRGRTGTVLACYLVKTFVMDPETAIAKLREMRPGSVETLEQEDTVKTFLEHLRKKRDT